MHPGCNPVIQADNTSYLREWPDWRASPPRYPRGNATVPVTGVSLGEVGPHGQTPTSAAL